MKNKTVIIFMGIVILILVIALSLFATLYFVKNNDSNNKNIQGEKDSEVNKLKAALVKEGYVETGNNVYVNRYIETAYYKYDFNSSEYIYGDEDDYAPANPTRGYHYVITRTYDVAMDIARQSVVKTKLKENYVFDVIEDQYNFKSGTGECDGGCGYLIDFKKSFLELLNKYDIDIEKLK